MSTRLHIFSNLLTQFYTNFLLSAKIEKKSTASCLFIIYINVEMNHSTILFKKVQRGLFIYFLIGFNYYVWGDEIK